MNPFQFLAKSQLKKNIDKTKCPNYKQCKRWAFWLTFLLGLLVASTSYYALMLYFTKDCRKNG